MLNTKKTIKINPEIFKFGGKHKKEKTMKNNFTIPLVSPNILKNKLLKRVQDKKNKELSNRNTPIENQNTNEKYNNEFNDSIQYLQVLSNEKKKNDENMKKEEFKRDLMKKTIRNKQPNLTNNNLHINLELPDELKEDYYTTHIHKQHNILNSQPSVQLSYNVDNNIPYGCLKGGIKKTYRSYKKDFATTPSDPTPKLSSITSQSASTSNKVENLSERELKLHKLKEKVFNQHRFIHNKINEKGIGQLKTNIQPEHLINNNKTNAEPLKTNNPPEIIINNNQNNTSLNSAGSADTNKNISNEIPTIKKKITTIRKYKLGKSKHNRTIGILLKDAQTKHKIMEDYKEIKNTNINDIKKYLHKNNLLKYGSSAPNDVTRKIYENSVLAGEIVNVNTDTIIHNMSNNKSDY